MFFKLFKRSDKINDAKQDYRKNFKAAVEDDDNDNNNIAKEIVQQDNQNNKKIDLLSKRLEAPEELGLEHIGA
jgi:hypothetical protein